MMTEVSEQNPANAGAETAPAPAAAPAPVEAAPATTDAGAASGEKPKAVFVENLSPSVTTKMLNEFFSLCGPIESITVRPKPNAEDGSLEAIVFFETSGAADTAVLLTNAILVDRVISISYFKGSNAKDFNGEEPAAEGKAAASGEASGVSPSSVWESIVAAGHKLGDNIQNAAVQFDQNYGVVKGFEDTMEKIDTTLGISSKAAAFSEAVQRKKEEYHVQEKLDAVGASLTQAGQQIGRTANNMYEATMQNEYVNNALNTLSGWGSAIVSGWLTMTGQPNPAAASNPEQNSGAATAAAATAETPAADPDNITVPKDTAVAEEKPKPAESSSDEVKIPSGNAEDETK